MSGRVAAGGLLADPILAHWLMTLPPPEMYNWMAAAPSSSSTQVAEADVARQLFDATSIGGRPDRFVSAVSRSPAIAQNTALRPSLEGRSASGLHRDRAHGAVRAKGAVRRIAGPFSRCTCAATRPAVAKR
jgi:hypothetical protein